MSIMKFSKVVLKNLISKPATLMYPMKKREFFERLKCIQWSSCVDNCPKKCLSMKNEYTAPSSGSVKEQFNA